MQLTTDKHKGYPEAVEDAFDADIDYAMLVQRYSAPGRYSPSECTGVSLRRVEGCPDAAHISTSYAEQQNLTRRMSVRRFMRLTNAFSKNAENHTHALALYFTFYNFVRLHKTL